LFVCLCVCVFVCCLLFQFVCLFVCVCPNAILVGELCGFLQLTLARGTCPCDLPPSVSDMPQWWASEDALEHRVSRATQLAARRQGKCMERARDALDKWSGQ
jgi:hypothetical protein